MGTHKTAKTSNIFRDEAIHLSFLLIGFSRLLMPYKIVMGKEMNPIHVIKVPIGTLESANKGVVRMDDPVISIRPVTSKTRSDTKNRIFL